MKSVRSVSKPEKIGFALIKLKIVFTLVLTVLHFIINYIIYSILLGILVNIFSSILTLEAIFLIHRYSAIKTFFFTTWTLT